MKKLIISFIVLVCAIWAFQACQNAQDNNPNQSQSGVLVSKTLSADAEAVGELHNAILNFHLHNSTPYAQVGYLVHNGELLINYSYVEEILKNTKQYFLDTLHTTENIDSTITEIEKAFTAAGMVQYVNGNKYITSMIDYLPVLYFNTNPTFNGHEYIDPIITAYKNRDPEKAKELIATLSTINTTQMPEVEAFISVLNHSEEFWSGYYGNNTLGKEGDPLRDLSDAAGTVIGGGLTAEAGAVVGAALGGVAGSCLYDLISAIVKKMEKEKRPPMRTYRPQQGCAEPPRSCCGVDIVVTPNNPQQLKKLTTAEEIKQQQLISLLNAIDNGTCQDFFKDIDNFNEAVPYVAFSQLYDLRNGIVTMKYFSPTENSYSFYTVNSLDNNIFPYYGY